MDRHIPRLQEITWSATRPLSYNKYRDRSSSGAAFQSDLPKIHEEGESEDDSTERRGRSAKSMVASLGDTNEEEIPDGDGTYASRGSFSISSAPGEGIAKETSATITLIAQDPSFMAERTGNNEALERRSNSSEIVKKSMNSKTDSGRMSFDGSITR